MLHVPGAFLSTLHIRPPPFFIISCAIGMIIIVILKMRRPRLGEVIVPRVTSKKVNLELDPRQYSLLLAIWFMPFTGVIRSFSKQAQVTQAQVTPQISALTAYLEEAASRIVPLDMAMRAQH
ncbi:hypothetical protein HJG60_011188 [Phyllostomus discolor]|uniref:Uncharacterized protein n=1 Tax=Phyllostomus discolor TaxID=89673 RepID=A0A834E1F9_9CHIR|nr:hypothetical protein HJG60_011188 [Phyllostomus discolor]